MATAKFLVLFFVLSGELYAQTTAVDIDGLEVQEPVAGIHVVDVMWGPVLPWQQFEELKLEGEGFEWARYRVVYSVIQACPYFYIDLAAFGDMESRIASTYRIPLGSSADLVGDIELREWRTPNCFGFGVTRGDYSGDYLLLIEGEGRFEISPQEDGPE
ncbi:hypothetical protein GF402_03655 [Candidatus Fermentibacteria bacterium]|nr:hypothetical protein [Candidatus Fermentibacteria bacterium]